MNLLTKAEVEKYTEDIHENTLEILTKVAEQLSIKKIAIVGGLVRDLIISKIHKEEISKLNDLDLIIEGQVNPFVNLLIKKLGKKRIQIIRNNIQYKTIELRFDGIKFDIASARIEKYRYPGANPNVENASLSDDLKRRDFSCNAIALELMKDELIDLYDGIDAISFRKLEFLHPSSASEDPTRIIRAARYATRLGFTVSTESLDQIKMTLSNFPWGLKRFNSINNNNIPPGLTSRLRMELDLLFNYQEWEKSLNYLYQWEAMTLLDSTIQKDIFLKKKMSLSKKLGLNPLTTLLSFSQNPIDLANRLQIDGIQKNILNEYIKLKNSANSLYFSKEYLNWKPSNWCNFIESNFSYSTSIALLICSNHNLAEFFLDWYQKWRHVKSPIGGKELINKGWRPGPKIGEEIKRLRYKRIDNKNP